MNFKTEWQFGILIEVKAMNMILGKCKFPISFISISSNICCRYTLELPL